MLRLRDEGMTKYNAILPTINRQYFEKVLRCFESIAEMKTMTVSAYANVIKQFLIFISENGYIKTIPTASFAELKHYCFDK